jgi:peptidoglycan-N-acetylglucosamine deacetylase
MTMEANDMIENPIKWPNDARCAVAITFDMDTDSILHVADPKTADTKICSASWLRYDTIAIPRLLRMYERYQIKQTFFIPGWTAEHYPETVNSIVEAGHEIALHGYLHEKPNTLSAHEEEYWFMRGLDAIRSVTGVQPRGFRAPNYRFSKHTINYLIREQFLYDSSLMGDDVPYVIEGDSGSLIELPTEWVMDDWPQYTYNSEIGYTMQPNSPDRAMEVFMAEFEAAWEYGGLWISVWHPFVSGRLARCSRIDKMIRYMVEKGGVWFATLAEIASYVNHSIDGGRYAPRREKLPYYDGPTEALNLCK